MSISNRVFALAAGLLICTASSAEMMKNEPADFRGVVWDQPFDRIGEGMAIVRDEGHVKYYIRAGDTQKIGHVDAIKVAYRFYKDQFSSGIVQTYGGANQKAVLAALSDTYGPPLRPRKRIPQYFWDGEKAFIVLTCEATSYCVVEISSKDVIQREQSETGNDGRAHKGKDKDGEKDGD